MVIKFTDFVAADRAAEFCYLCTQFIMDPENAVCSMRGSPTWAACNHVIIELEMDEYIELCEEVGIEPLFPLPE